jgi:hypothetical protein
MNTNTLKKRFKRSNNVVFRKIANECVLVPIHKDAVDLEALFSLNDTAARIWELFDGKTMAGEIINTIAVEFSHGKDEVETDVFELIGRLEELHFIEENS